MQKLDVIMSPTDQVYENDFEETEEYSIKSRRHPQGVICGNSCKNGECRISEEG